jgi:predicted nucleic acid-binding protein
VSIEKTIVIKDACILIDLVDLDLLEAFYQLEVTAVTTGFVIAEILDEEQAVAVRKVVSDGKLTVYDDGDIAEITALTDQHPGLSFADCSVLELAFRVPGIILSADGSLRNEAKRRQLTVKGSLWVLNQLVEQNFMTKAECLVKLDLYPRVNSRAPKRDIQLLINKLNVGS